ncbi:MAG: hypothetical protein M1840_000645 [Geoglossum simile]|nr:MAG: hypothetical protein M1840_000645 [Geoglossum simile]
MQQDQVEIIERKLAKDRGKYFRGTARIRLERLHFGNQCPRELNKKIVEKLKDKFETEGCLRLEPKHHIPAIIDQQILDAAIKISPNVSLHTLLDTLGDLPPELKIPPNCSLECLHGRHRIQAGREILQPKDKWWTVDLYLKDTSSDLKQALSEEYSNSVDFSDSEIYQKIRQYRSYTNKSTEIMFAEKRWWARLHGKNKRKDLKQLLKHERLTAAFDALLVIPGIWGGLRIGVLHKLIAMKCDEELLRYLEHILEVWSAILGEEKALMRITDRFTVEALELRAPKYSQGDLIALEARFRNGELFPAVQAPQDWQSIWSNLRQVEGLIPSVYTFFEDAKYLKPCARIMKQLFGKTKLTVYQAMCRIFLGCNQSDDEYILQGSEKVFQSIPGSLKDQVEFGYRQVWLYSWRHFTELIEECPRKEDGQDTPAPQEPDRNAWYHFAALASKLGFQSEQIDRLTLLDPDREAARDALLKGRDPRYYKYDEAAFERFQIEIVSMYQTAVDIPPTYRKPPLLVDTPGEALERRCGRAFQKAYENDRDFLFLDVLYEPNFGTKAQGGIPQGGHSQSIVPSQISSQPDRHTSGDPVLRDNQQAPVEPPSALVVYDEKMQEATGPDSQALPHLPGRVFIKTWQDGTLVDSRETLPMSRQAVESFAKKQTRKGMVLFSHTGRALAIKDCFDAIINDGTQTITVVPEDQIDASLRLITFTPQSSKDTEVDRGEEDRRKRRLISHS